MLRLLIYAGLLSLGAVAAQWLGNTSRLPVSQAREPSRSAAAGHVTNDLTSDVAQLKDKASDKPYLRPQIPNRPAEPAINFDPQADWPQ